ncbi:MAG TPA: prolyl oligopeptidase family serine peptidase [Spirochaetia bacterium]|nr:prolyl oligopeptidase family serine peptidase [Spirochaetia bacterium]
MSTDANHLRPDRYPQTRRTDDHDDFFGTVVHDAYRWLEEADNPEVLAWTQRQHDLAHAVLSRLPRRDRYLSRLREVWDYPRMDQPVERGGTLFFTRNDGLRAQPSLFARGPDGRERVLLNPNAINEDGTVALMEWEPSLDGRYLAYALSESGEDWRTVLVRDVETGLDLAERLEHIKFSPLSWMPDGDGFFYSRFPDDAADAGAGNRRQSHQLYYHRVGSDQIEDVLVFQHPTLEGVILAPHVTEDGNFLVVSIAGDSFIYNRLSVAELSDRAIGSLTMRPLFADLDASYELVGTRGRELLILTTRDAPRGRIIAVDPNRPDDLKTAVPESRDVIAHAVIASGRIVVTRIRDAHDIVELFSLGGEPAGEIALPGIGSTFAAGEGALASHRRIYLPFASFLAPTKILEHDLDSGETTELFASSVNGFEPDRYETRMVFATSPDGTRVPVFVTARKGLALDGSNRAILYGYGGFDISMKPAYRSWLPVWLEEDGVFAVAVLRGGGEYGDEWHLAGMFERKQNVFDDFAAAADQLVADGYTSHANLAIEGGSNGGLLVAASMLQHPAKYGAVLCHVPVTDMLRYQHFTAGRYWTSEFGDADLNEEYFRALRAYSPLHNVIEGAGYPPILITSADHDDRVVPMHSKKFAAALQQADPGSNVVLLRIETKAGHGAGKPTSKQIELQTDVFAFLAAALGTA